MATSSGPQLIRMGNPESRQTSTICRSTGDHDCGGPRPVRDQSIERRCARTSPGPAKSTPGDSADVMTVILQRRSNAERTAQSSVTAVSSRQPDPGALRSVAVPLPAVGMPPVLGLQPVVGLQPFVGLQPVVGLEGALVGLVTL